MFENSRIRFSIKIKLKKGTVGTLFLFITSILRFVVISYKSSSHKKKRRKIEKWSIIYKTSTCMEFCAQDLFDRVSFDLLMFNNELMYILFLLLLLYQSVNHSLNISFIYWLYFSLLTEKYNANIHYTFHKQINGWTIDLKGQERMHNRDKPLK